MSLKILPQTLFLSLSSLCHVSCHPAADAEGREKIQANASTALQMPSCLQLSAAQQLPPLCPWELSHRVSATYIASLSFSFKTQSLMNADNLEALTGQFSHISDPG